MAIKGYIARIETSKLWPKIRDVTIVGSGNGKDRGRGRSHNVRIFCALPASLLEQEVSYASKEEKVRMTGDGRIQEYFSQRLDVGSVVYEISVEKNSRCMANREGIMRAIEPLPHHNGKPIDVLLDGMEGECVKIRLFPSNINYYYDTVFDLSCFMGKLINVECFNTNYTMQGFTVSEARERRFRDIEGKREFTYSWFIR